VLPLYPVEEGTCACARGEDCPHPGKHPRTLHGVKDATTDRKQIKDWWEKWPKANVGIATGSPSGIFVLDVDGKVGKASLKKLEAKHGPLPRTVTVKTGKGRHLYFRCDGARIGNSVKRLANGIDVRGDGGYVVGAGSVHSSGAVYRYVDGEMQVASASQWLIDLISVAGPADAAEPAATVPPIPSEKAERARAYAEAAYQRELARLGKAPKHQRNDTLNVAAFKLGQLAPYGILNLEEVTEDLARVARQIGLDDHEIGPTIKSGLNAGGQHPRQLPFLKSHDRIRTVEPPQKSDDDLAAELARLGETDSDNAERFARRFGGKAIHTPGRGWLVYDGSRWRPDELSQVVELAKETAGLLTRPGTSIRTPRAPCAASLRRSRSARGRSTGC
jgi:putative DNA primase/helicase